MLDRHSALAIPDESYFIPQLADRHRGPIDVASFVDDLRRLPTLRDWGIEIADVEPRLDSGMAPGEAVAAVYLAYAAARGKERWGDKTPMYMQHLGTLERLFPKAVYVHLIRDGRTPPSPSSSCRRASSRARGRTRVTHGDFACQWRSECSRRAPSGVASGARYSEIRYEELVAAPERVLRETCARAGLAFEPAMLAYTDEVDVSCKPHQQNLLRPPTPGHRDWRDGAAGGGREGVCLGGRRSPGRARLSRSSGQRTAAGRLGARTPAARRSAAWNATACRPALACPGAGATRRSLDLRRAVLPAERHQDPVEREVVVAVGRDPGRVLPHPDLPVRPSPSLRLRRVRLVARASRRRRACRRRPRAPRMRPRRGAARAPGPSWRGRHGEHAVEVADEDPAVRDRGRRVAESSRRCCVHTSSPLRRVQRDDLARRGRS